MTISNINQSYDFYEVPWGTHRHRILKVELDLDFKVSSNPKSWGINKWFFISASNINPQISLILLNVVSLYNLYIIFRREMFKNEVIDGYMHCIMQN